MTGLFALAILVLVFMTIFEDQLFTKNDARKLIEEQDLKLTDNFKDLGAQIKDLLFDIEDRYN